MKIFRRRASCLLSLFLNLTPVQAQHSPIIRSIALERHPIFDTTAATRRIERIANALHIETREFVIRREILFREQDTLTQALIDETERNLRRLGYLGDVEIRQTHHADSLVDITVVTHEKWTLYPTAWITHEGGITSIQADVVESNFLGLGQSLGIGYDRRSNRRRPNGVRGFYTVPRLFNSEWESSVYYANSEDLKLAAVQAYKPFYTEASRWSGGFYADNGTIKAQKYDEGVLTAERFLDFQSQYIWGIHSSNDLNQKLRIGSALIHRRVARDSVFNSIAQHITLLNISLGWMERTYAKENHLNALGVPEDVPSGFSTSIVLGKDVARRDLFYFLLNAHFGAKTGELFTSGSSSFQGYRSGDSWRDATFSLSTTIARRTNALNTLAANASGIFGIHWSPGWQMYLDSPNRLRGIPAYALSGTRRVTVNIEDRFDNRIGIWFFQTGSVLFLDGGMIWDQGEGGFSARWYKSIGYGIRIANEKLQGASVIRIDFAYNVDRKDFEFIVSVNQLFSAFSGIETFSPLTY